MPSGSTTQMLDRSTLEMERSLSYDEETMSTQQTPKLPQGRQPYDPLVGLRVGAFTGGALGAVIAALTRVGWFILIGAIVGAIVGYLWERSKLRGEISDLP